MDRLSTFCPTDSRRRFWKTEGVLKSVLSAQESSISSSSNLKSWRNICFNDTVMLCIEIQMFQIEYLVMNVWLEFQKHIGNIKCPVIINDI